MNRKLKVLVKRAAAVLLIISLVLPVMSVDVQAKKGKTSGTHYNIKWNYDKKTKTLTLSGKGRMNDDFIGYDNEGWPWGHYCDYEAETVIFKEGITYIGNICCDMYVSLKKVSISESVTEIGPWAFRFTGIKKVNLPQKLKKIGKSAFSGTPLKEIVIPDTVTDIGEHALDGCHNLKKVKLPKNLKKIKEFTFSFCDNLKNISIPESVEVIDDDAFVGAGLTSITVPGKVKSIGKKTFAFCENLKKVTFKTNKVKVLEKGLFWECKNLKKVKIPQSVKEIEDKVFMSSGLTGITIPKKVESIGKKAFADCVGLKEVTFEGTNTESIGKDAFKGVPEDCVFTVPEGEAESMKEMLVESGLPDTVQVVEK